MKEKRIVKEVKYFYKKPTRPVAKRLTRPACRTKQLIKTSFSPNLIQVEEKEDNTKKSVKCIEKKIDSPIQSPSFVESTSALERAEKVQDDFKLNFHSFVKPMTKSHVTGGFWLGLPKQFCHEHLPKRDTTVVLVDEEDKEYETKYLVDKNGLSAKWRTFSIAHNLIEGDVLVFQLIEECKFKVYIVRASRPTEIDSKAAAKTISMVEGEEICKALGEYNQGSRSMMLLDDPRMSADKLLIEGDPNLGSDMVEKNSFSESVPDFNDVKSFEAFDIVVDGSIIDSEVPEDIRKKYYKLCCSQKCYLHTHLPASLNSKLIAGIIIHTVDVADAIRASKSGTPCNDLEKWEKTLKSLEDLGMTVGFLCDRLKKLVNISYEQKKKMEMKTLEHRSVLEEEIRTLNSKLLDAKGALKNLDRELEDLKMEE